MGHKPQRRETLCQRLKGNTPFEPCQGCSNTEVNPATEGKVAIGRPLHIKCLGIRKLQFVTVGRSKDQQQQRFGRDYYASNDYLLGRCTKEGLH